MTDERQADQFSVPAALSPEDAMFEALVDHVRRQRGIDFGAYKPTSLRRRISRRMQLVGAQSFGEYLDHLQATPDEFDALLDTLFINVTQFFRDPPAWDALRQTVLPDLVRVAESRPIRAWCAGVASGEEAYSLAMLLCEALGAVAFREQVKIFATDLDEGALNRARQTGYSDRQVADVPEHLRSAYFEVVAGRYFFRTDLRRSVIFGRHNLLDDAPISRLDLLVCRNTLMYFNREAQSRILARFHFALRDTGSLFLGRSEMLLTRRQLFTPVDAKARIFRKVPQLSLRDRLALLGPGEEENDEVLVEHLHLRDFAFDASPVAHLIVDGQGRLALTNEAARTQLGLDIRDNGRPFSDLEISYRPVELRSLIELAVREKKPQFVDSIEGANVKGGVRFFDVRVTPLADSANNSGVVSITFTDVTSAHDLRLQLEESKGELETAYEELQSTNEELETTNEELQSTIEELETTNEELQSTNEELETMNEELHSTNEEVRAINDQLQDRNLEVNRLNTYLRSIVDSVSVGIVVLDRELSVRMWNAHAKEMWGLREDEVTGRPFLNLDIGLPVDRLREWMREYLRGDGGGFEPVVLPAHDRRGKPLHCRVSGTALDGTGPQASGLILLMEQWEDA